VKGRDQRSQRTERKQRQLIFHSAALIILVSSSICLISNVRFCVCDLLLRAERHEILQRSRMQLRAQIKETAESSNTTQRNLSTQRSWEPDHSQRSAHLHTELSLQLSATQRPMAHQTSKVGGDAAHQLTTCDEICVLSDSAPATVSQRRQTAGSAAKVEESPW
jgi:hypothetical protein